MKSPLLTLLVAVASCMAGISCTGATDTFTQTPPSLEQLAMDSKSNILQQPHLWVNSGGLSVNPDLQSVAGWRNVIAPPWSSGDFKGRVLLNSQAIKPRDYRWLPGEFQRYGQTDSGIEVRTLLSPVFDKRAMVELVELKCPNGSPQTVHITITGSGKFGHVPEEKWGFGSVTASPALSEYNAQPNGSGWLEARCGDATVIIACNLEKTTAHDGTLEADINLSAGQTRTFAISFAADKPASAEAMTRKILDDPAKTLAFSRTAWVERLKEIFAPVPKLTSSNKELVDFYNRSILSYQLSRWDLPEFYVKPWIATSGMDGGAMCLYVWDYTYESRLNALEQPDTDREIIRMFIKANLLHYYAVGPFKGDPKGVWYAYNHYSLIRLIYYYVLHTGNKAFLNETINGKTVLDWAIQHATYLDDLSKPVELIDYGNNSNLLELHKTSNYTHYVPSPNGERCWSYRAVDEMAKWAGKADPGLSKRADALAEVIRTQLWSKKDGWLVSLNQKHEPTLGYSIQVFDLLRFDFLTPEQRDAIVSHLNEQEFLSKWGVHSYSKIAPGYDQSDVDWGGPGVYVGDAPELVGDLLHAGYLKQADDVLSRILWWGQSMPYYPQAIRADECSYRTDGRSNEISGSTCADMIVFGLVGMQVQIDGTVTVHPHLPGFVKDMKLTDIHVRGHHFDVEMEKQGYRVIAAGRAPLQAKYGDTTRVP